MNAHPTSTASPHAPHRYAPDTRVWLTGIAMVATAAVCFSAKPVLVKLVYNSAGAHGMALEPITVMAARLMFSLPVFLFIALWSNRPGTAALHRGDWLKVAGLALIGYYFSQLLDVMALAHISAGLERIVLFAYPTLVVLISALFLGASVRAGTVAALALTWGGVALAVSGQVDASRPQVASGVMLVLCAAFTFAIYSVGSVRMIHRLGATRFTALAMCGSSAAVGVHFLVSGATSPLALPSEALMWSAVMGTAATLLPAFLFSAGVARIGAPHAAILSTVGPVATIGLDAVALNEPVTAVHLAGTALVLAGVSVVGRVRRE